MTSFVIGQIGPTIVPKAFNQIRNTLLVIKSFNSKQFDFSFILRMGFNWLSIGVISHALPYSTLVAQVSVGIIKEQKLVEICKLYFLIWYLQ